MNANIVFHELFELNTEKQPDSIAVIFGGNKISYADLNIRANQVAHHLRALGVGAGSLVGLYIHRGIDMVTAILGILKAGGAYIPLDPSYPRQRLEWILDDSKAQFILTQSDIEPILNYIKVRTVCLDQEWSDINHASELNPNTAQAQDDLAYIIYTSGSTGKPKGVMISHGSLGAFVRIANLALNVSRDDKYLHNASMAYALSVRQLAIPLAVGATIVLATHDQAQDPLALFGVIKSEQVTLMDVVPSFWRLAIQRIGDLSLAERQTLLENHLRRIVSIGEPLLEDIPRAWRHNFGHPAELVNIFGQTETTGVVAKFTIPVYGSGDGNGIVSIGGSIPETQIYILDENLQPVKNGERGELCISSACLARGYLNLPDLTAEKFITNPFQDGKSERLYRTGDMAYWREDGNIQFLGRSDNQIKIRGQRLEIGEVESVMRDYPGIHDCVVSTHGKDLEEKILVAFVVPGPKVEIDALRQFLRERLPHYMVPSKFHVVDSIPRMPNGKVDRMAFESLDLTHDNGEDPIYESETAEIQTKLVRIWRQLLKTGKIGIHDDFFDLGGNSFLAVHMFARIEREVGIRLPLTTLFHAVTISQLSKVLSRSNINSNEWSPLVPINPEGDYPPFFGVHGHEGGVLFWRDIVGRLPRNQPFYALQAQGVDGFMAALTRVEDMASLYISEMRKIQPCGPYYLGGFSMGGEIAFEMSQQLVAQGEQVNLLVLFDTKNPYRAARFVAGTREGNSLSIDERTIHLTRFGRWKQKIIWYANRLSGLNLERQTSYLVQIFNYKAGQIVLFNLARGYRYLGIRFPDKLLIQYLRRAHRQAINNYLPNLYPGQITLFRSSESVELNPENTIWSWSSLTSGGLEIHHFVATHNLVNNEYAVEVARKLNECLVKARGL